MAWLIEIHYKKEKYNKEERKEALAGTEDSLSYFKIVFEGWEKDGLVLFWFYLCHSALPRGYHSIILHWKYKPLIFPTSVTLTKVLQWGQCMTNCHIISWLNWNRAEYFFESDELHAGTHNNPKTLTQDHTNRRMRTHALQKERILP